LALTAYQPDAATAKPPTVRRRAWRDIAPRGFPSPGIDAIIQSVVRWK
jgi:hypothetical protein